MNATAKLTGADAKARSTRAPTSWTCALALAGALACVHPRLEPATIDTGKAGLAQLPAEFELLCWNIHKQRRPGFAVELRRFSAGVELLVLQEATEDQAVLTSLPDARDWTLVNAFELGRDQISNGVATGSAATPTRERALFSPAREPVVRTPKSTLLSWVEIEGASAPLLLVNLHGINFRPAPALDAQLRALDHALDAHAGPVVVAGDFNAWSRGRRDVVRGFAQRHALVSVFANGAKAARFDDVYVRGLVVHGAEVLRSRSSDHDALRVVLALPKADAQG